MQQNMSNLFSKTKREVPKQTESASHKYLGQAGYVDMLTAGVYSYLPLGLRVLQKIQNIIREEMSAIGGQEVLMPALQPAALWQESGRYELLKNDILFTLKDHSDKELCLAPTHEEAITDLLRKNINSYRDLPFMAFQIQTKFRDEKRPRGGLLRGREFLMKDAYSFHPNMESLDEHYQLETAAYKKIFARCGLDTVMAEASAGAMGGNKCHEFMLLTESGEDEVLLCTCGYVANAEILKDNICPKCGKQMERKNGLELGHVFQLGTKYSEALKANYVSKDGKQQPIIMGCYGIGVSRLMAAVVEAHNDELGILWPAAIAPFNVHLITIGDSAEVQAATTKALQELAKLNLDVLYDDRQATVGEKLNDADLIGIPVRLVISAKTLEQGGFELKLRNSKEVKIISQLKELSSK